VFSLGVVLFELTTGARPFDGDSERSIAQAILDGDVPAPARLRPGYPAALEAIVLRALSNAREARFATAQELQLALEQLARQHQLALSSVALAAYMDELFGAKLVAWHDAQRAGRTLTDHLIATATGGTIDLAPPEAVVAPLAPAPAAPRPRRRATRLGLGAGALLAGLLLWQLVSPSAPGAPGAPGAPTSPRRDEPNAPDGVRPIVPAPVLLGSATAASASSIGTAIATPTVAPTVAPTTTPARPSPQLRATSRGSRAASPVRPHDGSAGSAREPERRGPRSGAVHNGSRPASPARPTKSWDPDSALEP
jgi:serine/threonine-protein kinase